VPVVPDSKVVRLTVRTSVKHWNVSVLGDGLRSETFVICKNVFQPSTDDDY
jgi:hypothetical protein